MQLGLLLAGVTYTYEIADMLGVDRDGSVQRPVDLVYAERLLFRGEVEPVVYGADAVKIELAHWLLLRYKHISNESRSSTTIENERQIRYTVCMEVDSMEYSVQFTWDEDALVWIAESDDIPGLVWNPALFTP